MKQHDNHTTCMVILSALFLLLGDSLISKVNPRPGENLWRLTTRIGDCVDVADSKLDILDSQNNLICSKIENPEFGSLNNSLLEAICSKIEKVDLANQCSQDFNFSTHSRVEALAKVGGERAVA